MHAENSPPPAPRELPEPASPTADICDLCGEVWKSESCCYWSSSIAQQSPNWATEKRIELVERNYQRVNDPRHTSDLAALLDGWEVSMRQLNAGHQFIAEFRASVESLVEALERKLILAYADEAVASAELSALRQQSLSPEEAAHALDQIPDNHCGWPPQDCPTCDSLREKLRLSSKGQK